MTYNKIFILVSLNLTKEFYKSLSDLPYVRNLEIYEFEDLNLNSLQRLVKLFKSDIKSYKINSSKIKLLSLEILGHPQKVFVNRNRKVFSTDLNIYTLVEFLDMKLPKFSFLITETIYQYNALKLILPEVQIKNSNHESKKLQLKGDLLGSDNWDSLFELFTFLNKTSQWIVLRNFEFLSDTYNFKKGDDIDILCDDIEYFTALMNAKRRFGGRCSYYVTVNNYNIPLDIRFIGDKYFDPLWASEMLKRKEFKNLIPTPSKFDYFFTLLYHVKLQKLDVKNIYIKRLDYLAKEINIQNLPENFVLDDLICAQLLNGFLSANNYRYTYTDDAVRNKSFLEYIYFKEINDPLNNWRILIMKTPQILFKKITQKFQKIFFKKKEFPKVY